MWAVSVGDSTTTEQKELGGGATICQATFRMGSGEWIYMHMINETVWGTGTPTTHPTTSPLTRVAVGDGESFPSVVEAWEASTLAREAAPTSHWGWGKL